jgi:transposase
MAAGGINPGMKEYIVRLTAGARRKLQELVESGTRPVRVVRRALILLKSDAGLTDLQIVEHVGCAERTVRNVRKRFCEEGLEGTLYDAARPGRPPEFTPRQKQQVVALACTEPPEGRARWTLELLCEHAAKRGFVESVSKSEVALWLKDHDLKPWRKKNVVRSKTDSRVPRANGRRA